MDPNTATIDDVLEQLDAIIDQAIETRSTVGYFATLYRRVTAKVKEGIDRSAFDDNRRMERLDVIFAQRYLDAYERFRSAKPVTRSWQAAFDQESNLKPIVLQHLVLGMSAHINLDLGIAAAEAAEGDPLSLKRDFFAINRLIGDSIPDTQARLTRIFGPLGLLDRLLGPIDERLSLFSITYARDKAWSQTLELELAGAEHRQSHIDQRDAAVADFAKRLLRPSKFSIRLLLLAIRALERGDVASRLRILRDQSA